MFSSFALSSLYSAARSGTPSSPPSCVLPATQASTPSAVGSKRPRGEPTLESDESRASKRRRANNDVARNRESPVVVPVKKSKQGTWSGRPKILTMNELQALKYVHELGSHGIRSFATGFLIEDYMMKLFYVDRMGVVESKPFDFIDEPHYLLLFVAATMYASPAQLGFFDRLRFPLSRVTYDCLDTYSNVTLDLSGAKSMNAESLDNLRFCLDVSSTRHLVPPHGAVGRGTIVVPVKPLNGSVHVVTVCGGSSPVVAKISWPSKWRVGEDALIRAVRKGLDSHDDTRPFMKNIVELKCSLTRTMKEMNLPRALMHLPQDEESRTDERVCRVLVMMEYLPLRMIDGVEELKSIFVDVIRGTHLGFHFPLATSKL